MLLYVPPSESEPPKTARGRAADPTAKEMPRVAARALHLVAFRKDGAQVVRVPADTTVTVGRGGDCDLQMDSQLLSRKHFTIREGTPAIIRDLGSVNGTRVNRVRLEPNVPTPLALGDLIEAGSIFFMLRDHDPHSELSAPKAASDVNTQAMMRVVVVEDPVMARLHQLVDMVARSTMPVLIVGETGVGKEIISTAVHARSLRADKPLVRINCAALPESLLESELFGFEKGAFTGAGKDKRGLIESADGGTFFLDEIGEMPLTTQAKLLRVLESGEIMRLGALKPRTIDVRFIAATNRHVPALVAKGAFRRDLYYRLNGITIPVPPLRERVAEIPRLAKLFLSSAAKRAHRRAPSLSADALSLLEKHAWPGNVRELKNVMERAITICAGDAIEVEQIILDPDEPEADTWIEAPTTRANSMLPMPLEGARLSEPPADPKQEARGRLMRMDAETERSLIARALDESGGNQGRAAEILGISRRTLINRLDEYGMKRPRKG
jgi:transcriptional regulator with GAF, ATPase, and Fis domain